MQAEVEFLKYSAQVAPYFTPRLFEVDVDRRCVILEYLEGDCFPRGTVPSKTSVSYAVQFFRQLNSDQKAARQFISQDAAEGFKNLSEHLLNIKQRLSGMGCDHIPESFRPQAKKLLAWIHNKYYTTSRITLDLIANEQLNDAMQPNDQCISPSDFGFHNAIFTREKIVFIDFEHSGWDDPAKAAIDFMLQPRVPVAENVSPLLDALDIMQSHESKKRYEVLTPILQLKWCCIILSILNPDRLSNMINIDINKEANKLISERLTDANSYIMRTSFCHTQKPTMYF